jgi:integrase
MEAKERRGRRGDGSLRERGRNSWELRFKAGGKARSVSFKGTRKEAKAELRRLLGQADAGALPAPTRLTVPQYVGSRIKIWQQVSRKGKAPIGEKTAERNRELLANQIAPFFADMLLQKLGTDDVERWHGWMLTEGRKDGGPLHPRTALHAHRLLSKALEDAARQKPAPLVAFNAAAVQGSVRVPEEDETEVVIIGDTAAIKEAVANLHGRTVYPAAMCALFGGLRRGEVLALRWEDVNLDRGEINVCRALSETKAGIVEKTTKTRSGKRRVAMPDTLREALREHRVRQLEFRMACGLGPMPEDALLFPRLDGSHQSPRAFSAAWAHVAAAIGHPALTYHALRHTHASQLIAAGVDPVSIAKRLGHKDANVTLRVYAHLFDAVKDNQEDRAAAAINAALA